MGKMILEDDLGRVTKSGSYRGKLRQNLRTVTAFLHHALHEFKVSDGSGEPVDNGPCLCVRMRVRVRLLVSVLMLMRVRTAPRMIIGFYATVVLGQRIPPRDTFGSMPLWCLLNELAFRKHCRQTDWYIYAAVSDRQKDRLRNQLAARRVHTHDGQAQDVIMTQYLCQLKGNLGSLKVRTADDQNIVSVQSFSEVFICVGDAVGRQKEMRLVKNGAVAGIFVILIGHWRMPDELCSGLSDTSFGISSNASCS
jgi:hypothetical protein